MIIQEYVEKICQFKKRGPTTKGEKEASEYILSEMEKMGLHPESEPFRFQSSIPQAQLIHFSFLLIASGISLIYPLIGSIIALFIIISYIGENTARFYWIRNLIPKRPSQNILGKLRVENPKKRIILSGHLDAARSGIIFHPDIINSGLYFRPMLLPFSIMLILFLTLVVRIFTGDNLILNIFQIIFSVLTLLACIIMIQWDRAPFVDGANDDATGVAVMMALANELIGNSPVNSEIWFLATGCEEAHLGGMRAFIKKHRNELDKENTYFISFECLGSGKLKYSTSEGLLFNQNYPPDLVEMARQIAQSDIEIESTKMIGHSDVLEAAIKRYPSICLIGFQENNTPANYHWPTDIPENVDYSVAEKAKNFSLKIINALDEVKTEVAEFIMGD